MDVFLTHGGMNSTMESLFFGVPMVAIPQMEEQAVTAQQIAALGLGQALTPETTTVTALREAVESVASDEAVRENVRAMRRYVRDTGGHRLAADSVEKSLHPSLARKCSGPRSMAKSA